MIVCERTPRVVPQEAQPFGDLGDEHPRPQRRAGPVRRSDSRGADAGDARRREREG